MDRLITEAHFTGGMAHVIRNTLGAAKLRLTRLLDTRLIDANVDMLNDLLDVYLALGGDDPEGQHAVLTRFRELHGNHGQIYAALGEIDASLTRGLQMTRRVMAYSAMRDAKPPEAVDLVRVIAELTSIYEASLSQAGIRIDRELPAGLQVKGDAHQVHSVLQNLLLNARDGIIARGGERWADPLH